MQRWERSIKKQTNKQTPTDSEFGNIKGCTVYRVGREAGKASRSSGSSWLSRMEARVGINERPRAPQRAEGVGAFLTGLSGRVQNDR